MAAGLEFRGSRGSRGFRVLKASYGFEMLFGYRASGLLEGRRRRFPGPIEDPKSHCSWVTVRDPL